jgi:energy-coupling factor transporter ATP-binding protein EcfA2
MALNVVMVTGPRRSGKSTLITGLINEVCSHQPHYIRLTEKSGTKHPPRQAPACVDCGVATATWVTYERDRVFETLPETLAAVQKHDELGCVLIEADTDPNLRHAYPYDTQLFTVPAPARVEDIFRTPQQTRQALQAMMNDSVAFAGEIFGLTPDAAAGSADGSSADGHGSDGHVSDGHVSDGLGQRADMSDSQIMHLMRSPLGEELATRIQCRRAYHGLLESDAVVVNTGVGGATEVVDQVVHRLEELARRVRREDLSPIVFCCDVKDPEDPRRQKLFEHFRRRQPAKRS